MFLAILYRKVAEDRRGSQKKAGRVRHYLQLTVLDTVARLSPLF